jgi:putative pyoverdin transport system ATP-binding/permease protein
MEIFRFLIRSSWRSMTFAVVASILSGVVNVGLLSLINSGLTGATSFIKLSAWSFIILCLFFIAAKILSDLALIKMGQDIIYQLRLQLARQILAVPARKLEEIGSHRLTVVLTDDVFRVTQLINFIPTICINVTIILGCLAYLTYLSWVALAVVIVFMTVAMVSYRIPAKKAVHYFRLARAENDSLYKSFQALIMGYKELKLHRERRLSFMAEVLEATADRVRKHSVTSSSIATSASNYGQSMFLILIGLLIFGLSRMISADPGIVTGSVLTILFLKGPIEMLVNLLPSIGVANVSLEKINELGAKLIEDQGIVLQKKDALPLRFERLDLQEVTHTYQGDGDKRFSVGPINLTLQAGELVFLTGGNGSGKTTLAKILTGLYLPESGKIKLNGQMITDENIDDYRQHFSAVFSDFYLFDGLLGLSGSELDEKAQKYLEQLQLAHKIKIVDRAFSNVDLSQGQRKRLALLTAYLEDRPFYVFDEWAADQDPHFRDVFYHEILPELKSWGKTILVISHDDRYYHLGDRVIRLNYGQIESDSSPQESKQLSVVHQ